MTNCTGEQMPKDWQGLSAIEKIMVICLSAVSFIKIWRHGCQGASEEERSARKEAIKKLRESKG